MASRIQVRGIDEELWFGDYSDAEAEKKAAESVAATVGRVVGAKPFPVAAQKLAEATRDPDCSLVKVVRILERDMALSARVLRLVNSASFALRTPCTSVRHAASLVGTQKLNQLATTAAILDMVDHTSVHASRILEHSAVVGGLCRYLGVHLGLPADELFTCGFLHDIGKLMLLEVEGKKYGDLLTEVGPEYDAIHLYERELFGFDHALLAGHVLSRWSIPDPVPKVVAWHHHVTRAYEQGPRWASLCSVLRLADLLSYALASEDDEGQVERAARSESASYLDISAAQLAAIWDELRNLHERSRALFRGEEPPDAMAAVSLRPSARASRPSVSKRLPASHPSLRAPTLKGLGDLTAASSRSGRALVSAPADVSIKDAPEGPKQFPCVVCAGPSFANLCPACHGYVCPEHQTAPDEWCRICRTEYLTSSHGIRLRPILILMLGAGVGATVVGACVSMATGRGFGSTAVLVGPLIGTGLAAGLVAIFHRYARRAWFLRTRPDRSAPHAAHISTPLPPEPVRDREKVPESGVRDSNRPANGFALQSVSLPVEAVESIFARASSGDLVTLPEPPVSLRDLALTNTSVTPATERGVGPRLSHGAPSSRRNASSRNSVRATAPTELETSVAPRASSRRAQPPVEGGSLLAPAASSAASRAPVSRRAPAPELAEDAPRAASIPAGEPSLYPSDESTREAAERGRTLKLLSEHSTGSSSQKPSTPSRSQAVPQATRAPSSGPEISVRPLIHSDAARPVEFPDYSEPPPPSEDDDAVPSTNAVEPTTTLSRIPDDVPSDVPAAVDVPHVEAPPVLHSTPVKAPSKAPRATEVAVPPQSWQAVLQATGTADGW
ncbi:MAG TPA: HDOD domain-containing protein [Polyangiaceae bacterium]|nr:HDOD domain-containing protein [Polyangiaceae bacterium]